VCIALIVTNLPQAAARFVATGHWPSAEGVALAAQTTTTRASLNNAGAQVNGASWTLTGGDTLQELRRYVSDDGRYVVFYSAAPNLIPGGTNNGNIFVRDTQLGTTTLVSVDTLGNPATGTGSSISGDGRYVVFESRSANIVPGDTNGFGDIFVRDLTLGTTVRASVDSSGTQGAGISVGPYISSNGRYVAFRSDANLGGPAPGGGIYLRDLTAGTTDFISIGYDGHVANDFSEQPTVSDDGRYVSFVSRASNVASPKTNLATIFDVYLRDRTLGSTQRISVGPGGVQGNSQSNTAQVSGDGTSVIFRSGAENLIPNDGNFLVDLFIRDLGSQLTSRIVENTSFGFASSDARYVAFQSAASNLVPGDTNGTDDIFVIDRQEGSISLASQSSSGTIGNAGSQWPSISADGRYVAFTSDSTNLVASDTNAASDVFLRDRGPVDTGAAAPYTYGDDPNGAYTDENVNVGTGVYTTSAIDLAMPGRILPFAFTRSYNSSDTATGPLGPAWSHSLFWKVVDAGGYLTLRRGDGQRDHFTRNTNGTYAAPPNVFDTIAKNGDSTFTLTLKNQTQYEFSTNGQLTRVHEPAGNQITLTYTTGNLTSVSDTVGRAVSLSYDTSNRITQLQDPLGRKVTYAYDTNGRLATVTDKIGNAAGQNPALHQWKYAYDGTTQHLTTVTDPDNRVQITNTYDTTGRVSQQRDGLSQLTTVTYNAGATTTLDARGNSSTQSYDARKRALVDTRVVSGHTLTLTRVYDASGNLTGLTDRNGKTTDYTYDTKGNQLTKTDPQVDPLIPRYVTSYVYDAKNNVTQVTDPRSFLTTFTYDSTTNVRLALTRQIDPTTNAVTKFEYADAANKGMPTRSIAPRGNTGPNPDYTYATSFTYDSQGNLITLIDPDAAKTSFTYDAAGRGTSRVDPDGYAAGAAAADHTWSTSYDENDQIKSETNPLGGITAYTYDGAGNRATLTDRNGNVTSNGFDANSRLITVTQKPDPVGNPTLVYSTQVTRDANGNATRVTQANGVIMENAYDALDGLISYSTHPDAQTTLTTTLTLDGDGNVLTKTTPAPESQLVTNTYDALSRLLSVAAIGLTTISYTYDATSRRTQMVDGTGTTTYSYDGLGRLTQAAQPSGTLGYGYDLDGNRTSLTYPGVSGTVSYVYTPGGRLDHLTDGAARTSTYTYSASGLAQTVALPNGLVTTYAFDRAQRLALVRNAVGTTTRTRHAYTLDAVGNRTALDEYVEGLTAVPSLTWAASVKVNDDAGTAAQDHPAIALGADGAHYLLWDDQRNGATDSDIYFSRRDPATGAWSANVKVNSDATTRNQVNPAISLDAANNAYAVWEDSRDGASNKIDTNIYSRKRTAAGVWDTTDAKVNDDTTGNPVQRNPRIAGTAVGAQTAVWVDFRASQLNIYSAARPAGGSWTPPNKRVTDNTSSTVAKDFPDVAVGSDGTAYAAWQDSRNGNPDIYFAKLPPGGGAWTANVKVSDDPGTASQHHPRVGVDASGNLTVVWLDDRTTPSTVRMSRQASGSATWGASTLVSDAAARPLSLALSVRADGKAYAAWHDNRGASTDVYGSEYDPWLNTWTTSTLVSDDPGSAAQQSPAVAYGVSELAAAWRDDRSGNADIRARRATLTGTDHFQLGYDGLERLSTVAVTNPEGFTLDAASNIASRTGPAATYSYDTANRLTSDGTQSYVWTVSDRLTSRGTDTFGYDPLNRLTSSTVAATSRTYAYNGDGLLQSRTQGAATSFLWDLATSPSALLQVGGDKLVYGLGPLYSIKADGTTLTFARDGGKSIRAELNSTGAVTASFRYRAYGQIAQSSGAASPTFLGYADQLLDPSGLYYMRARWYDPGAGRWMSRDPVRGDPVQPASLNVYLYANANPAYFSDPTGLITGGLCISFAAQAGVRGSYTWCPLVVASNGDVGWTSTSGKGGGTSVAASGTVGLQVSNANSVGCLGGPFVSGGISAGEGIVVGADDFAGYCKSEGIIGGITTGAGLGVDISPIALPVEVHAEATDTTTGVWFNVKDLFNFGRQFFQ
jgi:RHS repeat-associated protein